MNINMKNEQKFISGKTYTLSELFSGNRKIVIPDLQRDYCWGDSIHTDDKKELVSGFVNNIIDQWEESIQDEDLNLGLIYGYENPENYVQLCDGQQRITTLYLLLGILNKKTEDNSFQRQLISDYEYLQDDKEPFLQYSIRETSLYFLSDLVCNFFIQSKKDVDQVPDSQSIPHARWFFNEYNYDPSILSMLKAMGTIESILENKDSDWCRKFGQYLINNLSFLYYDLENRKNGEETFVVINTTGEPLSATQNLKPLVCNENINKDYCRLDNTDKRYSLPEDWETIETWFWTKRSGNNDTADAGFNEFLRWVTMLNSDKTTLKKILSEGKYVFPKEILPFSEIFDYWKIVCFLFDKWEYKSCLKHEYLSPSENNDMKGIKTIGQIDCFKILPLLKYCKTWGIENSNDREIYRLYIFLQNLTRIGNVGKSVNDIVFDAIFIGEKCKDIVDLVNENMNIKVSSIILSDEEKTKLRIIKNNKDNRVDIEEAFWNNEKHEIWCGEIIPMIQWSTVDNRFNINVFKRYSMVFNKLFHGDLEYEELDITRRALLSCQLNNYPRIFNGNKNTCFAWEYYDWKYLILDNIDFFKDFLNKLQDYTDIADLYNRQELMIKSFNRTQKWAEFVLIPELLHYCLKKNIQWWGDQLGWVLVRNKNATKFMNLKTFRLYIYLKNQQLPEGWNCWNWEQDQSCTVLQKNNGDEVAMDIYHVGNDLYNLRLFNRKNNGYVLKHLSNIAEKLCLKVNGQEFIGEKLTYQVIIDDAKEITNASLVSE